ncbi:MAG: hypothetical protein U0176_00425 [Bacteroidia bacterium]
MKPSRTVQGLALLLPLCCLFLSSCQGIHPLEEIDEGVTLQAREPGGPPIDPAPYRYDVLASYAADNHGYDFAVVLQRTSSCLASFSPNGPGPLRHSRVSLSFPSHPNDPDRVTIDEFESIIAYDPVALTPQAVYNGTDPGEVVLEGDAIVCFKWLEGHDREPPLFSRIEAGGICILGVITEPLSCPWCPDHKDGVTPLVIAPPRHP